MEHAIDPHLLGVHLNPWTAEWMGFEELQSASDILAIPFSDVRVALRFNDVIKNKDDFRNKSKWDFSRTERLVDKAGSAGKKIHFQTGFYKSLGYPEIHLGWVFDEFPKLNESGVKLDQYDELNKMALEYDFYSAQYFLNKYPGIATIQVGNEPFSRHLDVSRRRYLTRQFNDQEITAVQSADPLKDTPHKRLIIQNIPWDTPQAILPTLRDPNIDILGVNIYNNVRASFNPVLWSFLSSVKAMAPRFGKEVMITEYQCSPWLNDKREPAYNFSWDRFYDGIKRLKGLPVFLYDLEVVFYFAKNGDPESQKFIKSLS